MNPTRAPRVNSSSGAACRHPHHRHGEMRQRNLRLATLCLVTSWIAAVPVVGALSRDQHLDYDEELARLCVIYSSAAYGRISEWSFVNPTCNEKTKGFVLSETYVGDGTDAFGYAGLDTVSERIVVAFKGTSDLRDWMTDLRTWVRYTKRCAPAGTPAAAASSGRSRSGQHAATAEGEAIPPSSSSPPPSQEESRRIRRRRPRGSRGGAESWPAETGSWEEIEEGGDIVVPGVGGGSLGKAAADLGGAEIDEEAGGGGGGRGSRANGGWLDIRGRGKGGEGEEEKRETFGSSDEGGGRAEDTYNNGLWGGRPRWWQVLQHFVGGAGDGSWQQQQQQQQGRRQLEQAGGEEEVEEDDDDDDPQEDELIGNVHFGFCEYYQTLVAEGLADTISRLARENPSYGILVTGHSLGAAAAAVCAADLVQRLGIERNRVVLYTLGEPRTGDGIFAEGVNDRVGTAYRVVHNRDVVPHLALCCHGWFGKCKEGESSCPYQHSTEIVYADDMSEGAPWLMCNDSIGEDYACDPRSWDLSVSDHQHYFELPVGLYCATAPEDLTPYPLAQELEELRWAPYDAEMRVLQGQARQEVDEDDPFRYPGGDRLRNA